MIQSTQYTNINEVKKNNSRTNVIIRQKQNFDKIQAFRIFHDQKRITLVLNSICGIQSIKDPIFNEKDNQVFRQINKFIFVVDQDYKYIYNVFKTIQRIREYVDYDILRYGQIQNRQEQVQKFIFQRKQLKNKCFKLWFKYMKNLSLQSRNFIIFDKYMWKYYSLVALQKNKQKEKQSQLEFKFLNIQEQSSLTKIIKSRSCKETEKQIQNFDNDRITEQNKLKAKKIQQFFQLKYNKFELDVELLLSELKPFLEFNQDPPYAIYINTYNLLKTNTLNYVGLGIFHSSIELSGCVEVAFGGHDFKSTGVYAMKPRGLPQAQFYKSIYVDHCWKTKYQIIDDILQLAIQWHGNTYNIIHNNCNDFSNTLLMKLVAKSIPSWINRAANSGKVLVKDKGEKIEQNLHELVKYQVNQENNGPGFINMLQ